MARITTINAQPIAAAVVANAERRALNRISRPNSAITAGTQDANRLSCSEDDTRSMTGSNTSRNVGSNATWVNDPVSAVNAIGTCMIQLLTAVPMTASGLTHRVRSASEVVGVPAQPGVPVLLVDRRARARHERVFLRGEARRDAG